MPFAYQEGLSFRKVARDGDDPTVGGSMRYDYVNFVGLYETHQSRHCLMVGFLRHTDFRHRNIERSGPFTDNGTRIADKKNIMSE